MRKGALCIIVISCILFLANFSSADNEGALCCTDGTDQCGGTGSCDSGLDCTEDNSAWSEPDGYGLCRPDDSGDGDQGDLCCTDGTGNCGGEASCGDGLACIEDNSAWSEPDGYGLCRPDDDSGDDDEGCSAESDESFCSSRGFNCGTITDTDNCGDSRTVSCGTCSTGTCGGGGVTNVCGVPRAQISSSFITNLQGSQISVAEKNDRIMMKILGTTLSGKQITFKLYKKNFLWGVDALSPDTLLSPTITVLAQADSYAQANITLTQTQITGGSLVYFNAETGSVDRDSGTINVSSSISNAPPVAMITAPLAGGIYFVNSNIEFGQASYDSDSNITGFLWEFGDGTTSAKSTPVKNYTTAGLKVVSLKVTDEHGATSTQTREIMVANPNGYSIYQSINKPFHQEAVQNNNLIIDYSASASYIINTTTSAAVPCVVTVRCVQGNCPSATAASPFCAASRTSPTPIIGSPQSFSQTFFNWTFRDEDSFLAPEIGLGKVSGTKGYSNYGQKNITLQIKYGGAESTLVREFQLFNQRQCSVNGATWYSLQNGIVTGAYNTLNTGYCAGLDGARDTSDDCCPVGFMCGTGTNPGCQVDPDAHLGCSSYKTQSSCLNDASQRVKSDTLWDHAPYNCGKTVNGKNYACSCAWVGSSCVFNASARDDNNPLGSLTTCSYRATLGQCVNGYQEVTIDAESGADTGSLNDPACVDSTQVMPCGRPVIALPFLGPLQIVMAILVIAALYVILSRINRKPAKKARKRR